MPNQHRLRFLALIAAAGSLCFPAFGQTEGQEQELGDAAAIARKCIRSLDERAARLAKMPRCSGGPWQAIVQSAVAKRLSLPVSKECTVAATLNTIGGEGVVVLSGKAKDPRRMIQDAQSKVADLGLRVTGDELEQSTCEPPQEYVSGNGFKFPVIAGRPRLVRAKDINPNLYGELPLMDACGAAAAEAERLFPGGDWKPWVIDPGVNSQDKELRVCKRAGEGWVSSGDTAHANGLLVLKHSQN
jgi:hypothetical protein